MALPLTLVLVQIKCSSMHRRPAALLLRACTVLYSATQCYLLLCLCMQPMYQFGVCRLHICKVGLTLR